ncbi:MAG: twin-arginine translocase subunit TatC, partial [Sedimentisphaerales bacterium]|nr:twin-arginine translocase subunit TatC [Sedimentisphaerales bacterium]
MGGKKKQYDPIVDSTMSLGDHLEELRMRLLLALAGIALAFILCAIFGKHIIAFAKWPYTQVMTDLGENPTLGTLAPAEVVISYVKICLISGLIISSPWVFWQLWMFIAAGLYPHEKRYVHLAVPFSAALFVTGALFFIIVVAPICIRFFIKFNAYLGLSKNWTLQNYVTFIAHLTLVFGIAFQ